MRPRRDNWSGTSTTILPRLAKPSIRGHDPDRWHLRLAAPADFRTPPLSAMAGRRVERQLPEESGTAWLRRLLNEAQMLLHGHPANRSRTEADRLTINNSLWLWGPGQLPAGLDQCFRAVHSTRHPLARGLAKVTGTACAAVPASFAELQQAAPPTAGYW